MSDMEKTMNNQVILYKNRLEVRLEKDTVWLTQDHMADLFGKGRTTITEHIQNVFKEGELDKKAVCREFRRTGTDGKDYSVQHYNLDVIISVGYRVKSANGTKFRIWATNILRKHLVDGYTTNVMRLEGVSDEAKGLIKVITEYSRALDILDDYDHAKLSIPQGSRRACPAMFPKPVS